MWRTGSAPSAVSAVSGALHATCTSASTALERVTVKVASEPSDTFDVGPVIETSAESLSPGVVVVLSSSVSVMMALLTFRPTCVVVVPDRMMVSSPSTTSSSVGVMVSVPVPLAVLAGMVMLASDVTV